MNLSCGRSFKAQSDRRPVESLVPTSLVPTSLVPTSLVPTSLFSLVARMNLHQPTLPRANRAGLRSPPVVDMADPVHAPNRAIRRAALCRQKLPLHIRRRIVRNRHARIPALLAAIVHQPVFAYI
jgi:hypothetical protein